MEEHISSTSEFKATRELTSFGLLDTARMIFTNLEGESKDIPVTGKYIEAVTAIGLNLMKIIQIMDKDEEISSSLGSHIWPLAILLEDLSKQSSSSQGFREETTTQIAGIRSELDNVKEKLKKWCFSGGFMRTSSPDDRLQAMVWKVLDDIPLLANLAPQTR
ncbi:hypothetical protein FS837_001474 [Tulasnella sp. UAMH 9824]|nr:hypothetical protein FS837_001474 [Tulasnella sp. UAMH 9824]